MMEVSADLETADERNTETERALAEAKAEADEYHGHLQQLMDAQRRITEQLAEREAENEASPDCADTLGSASAAACCIRAKLAASMQARLTDN